MPTTVSAVVALPEGEYASSGSPGGQQYPGCGKVLLLRKAFWKLSYGIRSPASYSGNPKASEQSIGRTAISRQIM